MSYIQLCQYYSKQGINNNALILIVPLYYFIKQSIITLGIQQRTLLTLTVKMVSCLANIIDEQDVSNISGREEKRQSHWESNPQNRVLTGFSQFLHCMAVSCADFVCLQTRTTTTTIFMTRRAPGCLMLVPHYINIY